MHRLALTLLGGFGVTVDGQEVPATAWSRRQPTHLVKVLALAPRHELHREQVMDALWPGVDPDLAAPRLHKAAHYARRALGLPDAVVLAGDTVRLCAGAAVDVDALAFEAGARAALAAGDASDAGRAADAYPGDLLPADPYEPWAEGPRERLRLLHRDLLRLAGRWADLAAADPTDERAHLELARAAATSGDDAAALRWLERLEQAMRRELGTAPGQAVAALRRTLLGRLPAPSDPPPGARLTPAGRDAEMRRIERLLAEVRGGVGQVLFVSGAPGMGTTSVLHALEARARARGLAVGSGVAARTAGAWPYAPVLEALSDLCRRDPRLLAGLGGPARAELERVLAGAELAWDGATSHQRLYVAAAELVTLAAGDRGAVLVVDDADESDEATLRLLHYLARATATARVLIAVGHRPAPGGALARVRAALLARDHARTLELRPIDRAAAERLVRAHVDDAALVATICDAADGVPLALVEAARAAARGDAEPWHAAVLPAAPDALLDALAAGALLGSAFDADELAAAADLTPAEATAAVTDGVAVGVVRRTETGAELRHPLVRDALLARLDAGARRAVHLRAARAFEARGPAVRVAHHLREAGEPAAAVPWVLRAAETHAAVGAYRDALAELDTVRTVAEGSSLTRLLELRADLLAACGDAGAQDAYREALAEVSDVAAATRLRVRLAKASVLAGDLVTAGFALEGLEPEGEDVWADVDLLLTRGHLHLFTGDLGAAQTDADQARRWIAITPRSPSVAFDLLTFDGLLAHLRGELYPQLQAALRRGAAEPRLASGLFDSHLCVAEYLLYGPSSYDELATLATTLRESAERAGVQRAVAFADALLGEAALLAGDLDAAEGALTAAADAHGQTASPVGEAHSLQRLAEVRLAQGDAAGAKGLLARALQIARWSSLGQCLLPRVFGTQVSAAASPGEALAVVEQAVGTLSPDNTCSFCSIMLDAPAARAFAEAGDLDAARQHLARAEASARRWQSAAWDAAVLEARAHVTRAEGDDDGAADLLRRAADAFTLAGQPLDAQRCLTALPPSAARPRPSTGRRTGARPTPAAAASESGRAPAAGLADDGATPG